MKYRLIDSKELGDLLRGIGSLPENCVGFSIIADRDKYGGNAILETKVLLTEQKAQLLADALNGKV